jgi:hypothetical protein
MKKYTYTVEFTADDLIDSQKWRLAELLHKFIAESKECEEVFNNKEVHAHIGYKNPKNLTEEQFEEFRATSDLDEVSYTAKSLPVESARPLRLYELGFDKVIEMFRNNELSVDDWNFCTHSEGNGIFAAYIMGEGSEQCLAHQGGFKSKQEVIDLFHSLGVKYILPGVG